MAETTLQLQTGDDLTYNDGDLILLETASESEESGLMMTTINCSALIPQDSRYSRR